MLCDEERPVFETTICIAINDETQCAVRSRKEIWPQRHCECRRKYSPILEFAKTPKQGVWSEMHPKFHMTQASSAHNASQVIPTKTRSMNRSHTLYTQLLQKEKYARPADSLMPLRTSWEQETYSARTHSDALCNPRRTDGKEPCQLF